MSCTRSRLFHFVSSVPFCGTVERSDRGAAEPVAPLSSSQQRPFIRYPHVYPTRAHFAHPSSRRTTPLAGFTTTIRQRHTVREVHARECVYGRPLDILQICRIPYMYIQYTYSRSVGRRSDEKSYFLGFIV